MKSSIIIAILNVIYVYHFLLMLCFLGIACVFYVMQLVEPNSNIIVGYIVE